MAFKYIIRKNIEFFATFHDVKIDENFYVDTDERKRSHVTLDNVTSIQFDSRSIEKTKQWLIYALPNLNHLILSNVDLPLQQIVN